MHQPIESGPSWRPVPGYEACYDVSDDGRVRNASTKLELAPSLHHEGYLTVGLRYSSANWKNHLIHRLVAAAFIGECPEHHEINHINGDRKDNRIENLEYLTHQENVVHSYQRRGVIRGQKRFKLREGKAKGTSHYCAKLTDDQVREIRRLGLTDVSCSKIAAQFGISESSVVKILKRKSWKHIA